MNNGGWGMVVRATMVVRVGVLRVRVPLLFVHRKLRGGDAGPQHLPGGNRRAVDGKAAKRGAKLLERQARVQQRAQHHVAGRAGEAVKIQNT